MYSLFKGKQITEREHITNRSKRFFFVQTGRGRDEFCLSVVFLGEREIERFMREREKEADDD